MRSKSEIRDDVLAAYEIIYELQIEFLKRGDDQRLRRNHMALVCLSEAARCLKACSVNLLDEERYRLERELWS